MRTLLTARENFTIEHILYDAENSGTINRLDIVKLASEIYEESDVPLVDAYQIALNKKLG
jgi:hypothetical protein